jgi:hypothetical protein
MDGETRVEIKTIDYITNGKYPDHRVGLQELPVEMKLRCGKCLQFPNGRLLNAFLEGVGHLFNMKRESYSIICEECRQCGVGIYRRALRANTAAPLFRHLPDGREWFPDTQAIKVRSCPDDEAEEPPEANPHSGEEE